MAPRSIRDAAGVSLSELLNDYRLDLRGRGLTSKHVNGSANRIERIIRGTGWNRLIDVQPDSFVRWRATLSASAKTKKKYQTSLFAFLNWLVRMHRLEVNPLAEVDAVDRRGKSVRPIRAFAEDELKRLLAVAGRRLPAYLVLAYTGLRKSEVKALTWGDLHLDGDRPHLLARETTTKDREKRAIPLHRALVPVLRAMRSDRATDSERVFRGRFPKRGSLLRDMKRAEVARVDALGRVAHFHSFRKTFQTLGVRYGINQRSAQELLGHSDPKLTANVYTDVPSLALHEEVSKLPWLVPNAQPNAQRDAQIDGFGLFKKMLAELIRLAKSLLGIWLTDESGTGNWWRWRELNPRAPSLHPSHLPV